MTEDDIRRWARRINELDACKDAFHPYLIGVDSFESCAMLLIENIMKPGKVCGGDCRLIASKHRETIRRLELLHADIARILNNA
jgi:hypothetical protein